MVLDQNLNPLRRHAVRACRAHSLLSLVPVLAYASPLQGQSADQSHVIESLGFSAQDGSEDDMAGESWEESY